jgi:hypothetical protein
MCPVCRASFTVARWAHGGGHNNTYYGVLQFTAISYAISVAGPSLARAARARRGLIVTRAGVFRATRGGLPLRARANYSILPLCRHAGSAPPSLPVGLVSAWASVPGSGPGAGRKRPAGEPLAAQRVSGGLCG